MEWIIHVAITNLTAHVIGDPGWSYSFQIVWCTDYVYVLKYLYNNTQNIHWHMW